MHICHVSQCVSVKINNCKCYCSCVLYKINLWFTLRSPKISKVAPPKPFFPRGSLVHDYPTGHLDHVQNRVSQSELSLVMFYAPWCAESQHARSSYEYVARLFYREVIAYVPEVSQ